MARKEGVRIRDAIARNKEDPRRRAILVVDDDAVVHPVW